VTVRDVFYRDFPVEVRAASEDAENRTYEFVVATEAPVDVGIGRPEVLRMRGIDWSRMKPSCSVLDVHDRSGIKAILGKATAKVVGRALHATIVLDKSPEGDAAKIRLDSGSLRTASIGYRVFRDKARELRDGEFDGKGESRVEGPALVQNAWQPYEITLCPVPADERAVRIRSFPKTGPGRRSDDMKKGLQYSELPADEGELDETGAQDGAEDQGERDAPAPKKKPAAAPRPQLTLLPSERAARDAEALKRQVVAITPKGLEGVAERALLEGCDLEETRERLLKASAKRSKPQGTPEPVEEPAAETRSEDTGAEALTPDAVERALKGLRS
jgi:hypothetical protein